MISETVINATRRDEKGKNAARRLRAGGRIPAAVYGPGGDPIPVSVNARELAVILRSDTGRNTIFTLAIEGADSSPVMIKHMDVEPVRHQIVHTDLVRIDMRQTTQVDVRIEFEGEPEGVKVEGGLFEVHLHAITVECLPRDIPEKLTIDVSDLKIGDHILASQIPVDADQVTIIHPDLLVAAVVQPPQEEPETTEEGATTDSDAASSDAEASA